MAIDLSRHHEPITRLFDQPSDSKDGNQYCLSKNQVEFFHANGYLAGLRLLNDEQIEVLRNELADLVDPNHPSHHLFYEFHSNESTDPATVLFHALGAWRISPAFHDLLWNPAFLMPASQLLGGSVRFWHDQLFCKPAHHGGVVAWHQDYSYWTRTQPMAHLSCWIGLDDSTRETGCVHYVPASHRWNLLPITGLADDMQAIQSVLSEDQKAQFKPVAIELKAGEASFHHPLMVHGSYENRSDRPRRGAVINVFRDGVRSASNDPPLEGVPPIPAGAKMDGQFFPLLFDPGVRVESSSDRIKAPSGMTANPRRMRALPGDACAPPWNISRLRLSKSLIEEDTAMNSNRIAQSVPVTHSRPNINVTPLIDVLLVMLIIFMIAAPLKPARFLTKVPAPPEQLPPNTRPRTDSLVVTIKADRTLMLNGLTDMGSVYDTSKLSTTLFDLFQKRLANHAYRYDLRDRNDLAETLRIQRTVYIKAPRALPYADVVRVLDSLKGAGASPIGLQIDDLN